MYKMCEFCDKLNTVSKKHPVQITCYWADNNLSQWAEAQFNLLQLYKKCEKEKLMNKKLSNMKSTSNETHL